MSQQPPQGMPFSQAVQPPPMPEQEPPDGQSKGRSPEEIKADMEKLNQGIRAHADVTQDTDSGPSDPESEKAIGEDADDQIDGDFEDDWLGLDAGDIFNNPKIRKRVEKGLKKMEVEDLIMHGEVVQDVTLISNKIDPNRPKLWVTFRSVSAIEDLAIKKRFYDEEGPDRFMLDRYSIMNLCIGLKAINGKEQPPHLDENGEFDDDEFKKKYRKIARMPHQLLAFLVINYLWFDERVRRILVTEELGNG